MSTQDIICTCMHAVAGIHAHTFMHAQIDSTGRHSALRMAFFWGVKSTCTACIGMPAGHDSLTPTAWIDDAVPALQPFFLSTLHMQHICIHIQIYESVTTKTVELAGFSPHIYTHTVH